MKLITIQEHLAKNSAGNHDPFRESEKFYRYYENVQSDFSDLIDLNNPGLDLEKYQIKEIELNGCKVYEFGFPQGVLMIKGILGVEEQINISRSCLNEFIKPPNRTNLFVYE